MTDTCATCRFSFPSSKDDQIECHARPPQVSVVLVPIQDKAIKLIGQKAELNMGYQSVTAWPDMPATQWCGSFEPKGASK